MAVLTFSKKRKGFSLLEVLIAVVIINVGVFSSVNLITFTLNNWKATSQKLQNTLVAQGKLEQVRNYRDNNPANWTSTITPPVGVTITPGRPGQQIVSVDQDGVSIVYHLYDWR